MLIYLDTSLLWWCDICLLEVDLSLVNKHYLQTSEPQIQQKMDIGAVGEKYLQWQFFEVTTGWNMTVWNNVPVFNVIF